MKYYIKLKIFIVLIVIAYVTIGVSLEFSIMNSKEIFPIFSWSLYSKIPNTVEIFSLKITQLNGKKLNTPLFFEDSHSLFHDANSVQAYQTIQDLGWSINRGDIDRGNEIRRYLEEIYLGGYKNIKYELVKRSFNPLNRLKSGELIYEKNIAEYEINRIIE